MWVKQCQGRNAYFYFTVSSCAFVVLADMNCSDTHRWTFTTHEKSGWICVKGVELSDGNSNRF